MNHDAPITEQHMNSGFGRKQPQSTVLYFSTAEETQLHRYMSKLTSLSKRFISRITSYKPVQLAMRIAIRLIVPRSRIGAAVTVFNPSGEVLLLHHTFHGSHPWALPGGWVDRNEMPDAAVIRELREEVGLTASLGDAFFFTPSPPGTSVNVYFWATEPVGEPTASSYEINRAAWFSPHNLPNNMLRRNYEAIHQAHQLLQARGYFEPQPAIEKMELAR